MTVELQMRLFGGLQIRLGEMPTDGFVSSKAPALLAYLAVTRRPHQRDALAALLWGEMPDADARNNLRQALSSLRRQLAPFLLIERDAVALNPDAPMFVDAADFLVAIHAGSFERAAALYRGEFLEGVFVRDAPAFEEWALAQRARFRELALRALHRQIEAQLGRAAYDAAIITATRLLTLDPWREEAHRQLMLALVRTGQRGAALAQFETCRQTVQAAFGVEPSDETLVLAERIRAAMRGPRQNLPAPLTGFVGREAELSLLRQLLASPAARLIALVGPGGTGKTRLALEVAGRSTEMFLHGAWLVPLAAVDPDLAEGLPLAIIDALRLPIAPGADPRRHLGDALRSRELLLVLDNMEHLLAEAAWLSQLLAGAPGVHLLVTSRERLDLQAERVIELSGLTLPAAGMPAQEAADAVALFVRRARRVQATFTLDEENAMAVGQICRHVGGSPLAIELAAAWAHRLTCAEIAARIADNLDFLATTRQDMPARQRSLRAVFDHSWARLSPEEKAAFPLLAVFSGGFTSTAAAEICGIPSPVLASLADRSLVRREGTERYELHETLGHYAAEQLALLSGRATVMRLRHGAYYAGLVRRYAPLLKGAEQQRALAAIGREIDNIRAAWQIGLAQREMGILTQAAEGLYHFYMLRGWLAEGLAAFRAAHEMLAAAGRAVEPLLWAHLTNAEAKIRLLMGQFDEAANLLVDNLTLLEPLDADAELATALCYLGALRSIQGQLEEAEHHLRRSRDLRQALGDAWGEATSLLEWARIAYVRQDFAGCQRMCHEGLALAEEAGDRQLIAHFLTGMSLVGRELGDVAGAQEQVTRSLAVYAELDDPYGLIQGYLTLGGLLLHQGRHEEALPYFEKAVAGSREIGFRSGEADGLHRLAQIAAASGAMPTAAHHWRQALHLALELGEEPLILEILYEMGRAWDLTDEAGIGLLGWLAEQANLGERRRARVLRLLDERGGVGCDEQPQTLAEATALAFEMLALV